MTEGYLQYVKMDFKKGKIIFVLCNLYSRTLLAIILLRTMSFVTADTMLSLQSNSTQF